MQLPTIARPAGALQILVRSEKHPIFAEVWKQNVRGLFKFLSIDRYWPVSRTRWNPEPGKIEELVTLPNRRSMEDYQDRANEIRKSLPIQTEKYGPGLLAHQRTLGALGPKDPLYKLAAGLEALLADPGDPKLDQRPNLVEFWDQPEQKGLRGQVQKLLEDVRYGDPLVISGKYGKGRVLVFTTTAGQKWNNWAGMFPISATYPVFMVELQKFLTSTGTDANLTVGTPVTIHLDAGRYEEKMELYRLPTGQEGLAAKPAGGEKDGAPAGGNDVKIADIKPTSITDGRLTFLLENIHVSGNYKIVLSLKGDTGGANQARTEERAFSFNVDTNAEGNLQRATREQLDGGAPGAALHTPLDDTALKKVLANRPSDWSESPWLFLLFLAILVAEQALAVHLSFHLRGSEAQLPSQAVTPHAVAA